MRPGRFELPISCRTFFLARRLPCKFFFETLELNNGPCAGPGYGKLATSQRPNVPTRSRTWVVAATARRPNHKTIKSLHPVADFVHFFFWTKALTALTSSSNHGAEPELMESGCTRKQVNKFAWLGPTGGEARDLDGLKFCCFCRLRHLSK